MLQAEIREKLGDRQGARQALKSALALAPEKLDAARRVAQLALEDGEYREAAEALIRIARLCKDIEELRWVFFTLGDIYDRHIPDAKRAEAAFRRVLKLAPGDVPALERLATLYRREHQFAAAAEQLEQLIRVEPDPDRVRAHQLSFAEVLEQMGDGRRAEQVLEAARRSAPTDLVTIKALADFYGRQRAHSALAIHLNRAVADLRRAIETDLGDSAAWLGMVEILQLRGRRDPARAVAAMAMALGHESPEWVRLVDGDGVPGAGAAAADASLDDLLAPEHLPTAVRTVMRIAGPALERIAPFDPRAYRAEKLGARDIFRLAALDIARWFGVGDVEVWVTTAMPRACMPVASGPPASLVVGRDLLGLDERERMFVLVRTMKVVHDGLTLALRMQPTELALLLGALVHVYDPNYRVSGVDEAHLADWSRRISKQLGRRTTEELHHVVVEMAGSPDYDPLRLATASAEFANRVALVAGGSARAALGSLLKLAGEPGLAESPSARLSQLTRCVEARALVSFAVSEAHFEARHRTGADRG
jgi:tetratricopeptide (TPR) repeat protein